MDQAAKDALVAKDQAAIATDGAVVLADGAMVSTDQTIVAADQAKLAADQTQLLADQTKSGTDQAKLAVDQSHLVSDESIVATPNIYLVPPDAIEWIPNDSSVKACVRLSKIDPAIYAKMADVAVRVNSNPHGTKASGGKRPQSMMRYKGGPDPAWMAAPSPGGATAAQKAHDVLIIEVNGINDGDSLEVGLFDSLFPYQPIYRKQHTPADMAAVCPIRPGEFCCCVENGHDPSKPTTYDPVLIGLSAPFIVHTAPHVPLPGEYFFNGFNVDETPAVVSGVFPGLETAPIAGGPTRAYIQSKSFWAQPYGATADVVKDMAFVPTGKKHAHFQVVDRNGSYTTLVVRFRDPTTGMFPNFTFKNPSDVFHVRFETEGHWTARKYVDLAFLRLGTEIINMARKSWDPHKFIPTTNGDPIVVVGMTQTNWELLTYTKCAFDASGLVQPPPVGWQHGWINPDAFPYAASVRDCMDQNNMTVLDGSLATRQGPWQQWVGSSYKGMNLDALNDHETGANVRHLCDFFLSLDGIVVFEDGIKQIDYKFATRPFALGDTIEPRFLCQIYHAGAEDGYVNGPNYGAFPYANHDPFNLEMTPLDVPAGSVQPVSNGDLTQAHFDNISYAALSSVPASVPVWSAPVPVSTTAP